MIGQKHLLHDISYLVQNGNFPRFSIILGYYGSERNEVGKYIANQLNAVLVNVPDCKVDIIRDVILNAYKVETVTVYNLQDVDSMSLQAKNALLKVTEEPPNKAYFVMTLNDINNTLPTIKSRGTVFEMEPYSYEELEQYCSDPDILKLVDTPGEIDIIKHYGVDDFYGFVNKVADNIGTVNGCNAFKITQSIKVKDTDETGYDMRMFLKLFCSVCMENGWYKGLKVTSECLSRLRVKSINKAMLFDKWILDIRQEWEDGNC